MKWVGDLDIEKNILLDTIYIAFFVFFFKLTNNLN